MSGQDGSIIDTPMGRIKSSLGRIESDQIRHEPEPDLITFELKILTHTRPDPYKIIKYLLIIFIYI
jgi:hypothetical protein